MCERGLPHSSATPPPQREPVVSSCRAPFAWQVGIQLGDRLWAIDGEPLAGRQVQDVIRPSSHHRLDIERGGRRMLEPIRRARAAESATRELTSPASVKKRAGLAGRLSGRLSRPSPGAPRPSSPYSSPSPATGGEILILPN